MTSPRAKPPGATGAWPLLRPLVTGQPKLPWISVGLLNFVWFAEVYNALLHGVGVTFAARRLTADPRMIVLVSTAGLFFSGTIGPVINYLSDRIWTPMGRRRPFVVTAYFLSGAGLIVIPLMNSFSALAVAVTVHACIHSFASPMEPLYMELVPQAQQGRAQAMRNASIQLCVLFFFQLVLVQFDGGYPGIAAGVTGVHLAFWLGAALLILVAIHLLLCTRESPPAYAADGGAPRPRIGPLLQRFPREVFADWRWWPVYGIYVAPGLIGGVWGSLQPLMLVDQFGYSMTEMARIGLSVSLAGLAVIGPLLGYFADGRSRFMTGQFLLSALLLAAAAAAGFNLLPRDPRELPGLFAAAGFILPLGLAGAALLFAAVRFRSAGAAPDSDRSGLIVASILGQIALAVIAWVCLEHRRDLQPQMPAGWWLANITLSQVLGLAASVAVGPLLFSRIPPSRFGTVSSGFGISSAVVGYLLGNLGGTWVHAWNQWRGTTRVEYSSLWLLQAAVGLAALWVVRRCLRTLLKTPPAPAAGNS